jgi:hypothetical protein
MKRLIEDILNIETGEEINASKLLSQPEEKVFLLRRLLAEHKVKNTKLYVCSLCNQRILIAGNKKSEFFFKHHQDSDNCPIKTNSKLSQKEINRLKYQGAKESTKHKKLKRHIYNFLTKNKDFTDVVEERVIRSSASDSKLWKKPDVSSSYKGEKVIFEIQLSTTYLNVIVDRELFYKNEKIYIIWFFNLSSLTDYRFTEKDILYSNNNNAFIINDETKKISEQKKELTFLCHYKYASIVDGCITTKWNKKYITISDLQFSEIDYKAYYYNYKFEKEKLNKQLELSFIHDFEEYWLHRKNDSYEIKEKQDQYFIDKFSEIGVTVENFTAINGILNALYSLKVNKIIGFKFANYLALSNYVLESLQEYTHIYLWGLFAYNYKEKVEKQDMKKGKFANKIARYKQMRYEQNTSNIELFYFIFPEIKQVLIQKKL